MIPLYRLFKSTCFFIAFFISLLGSATSFAVEEKHLLVFHSGLERIDSIFSAALDHELQNKVSSHKLETFNVNGLSQIQLKTQLENTDTCVLTIGLDALEKILATRTKVPVFSTLVSRVHLDNLIEIYSQIGNPLTGIYEEQSFRRQLLLSQSINRDLKNIAVILGRQTRYMLTSYQTIANELSMTLLFDILKLQESPQRSFSRLNIREGFLMLLNDQHHYSERNLPSLLVSSYKKQIPLIGSKILDSDSAAIASIYTPYKTLAAESAKEMQNICHKNSLSKAKYGSQYKIRINRQIAKHLGYEYLSEIELKKSVFYLEQQQSDKNKL